MSELRVSVLMPVFNGERFLAEAIESVLAQTMPDFELIVVDDGSTDSSADIVRGFADHRVRLLPSAHQGVAGALNAGLQECRAPFVARLDADDVMEPQRLERQLAFLEARTDLGGAASYYSVIDASGRIVGGNDAPLHTVAEVAAHLDRGGRLIYPHPTVIFRRAAVAELGGYDPAYETSEDVELFLRMYSAGHPLVFQPERLTRFRVHPTSVTATKADRQFVLNALIFDNFRRSARGLPPRSLVEYEAWQRRHPVARVQNLSVRQSYRLLRRSQELRVGGQRTAGLAVLAAAGLLHPAKVLQQVRGRLAR